MDNNDVEIGEMIDEVWCYVSMLKNTKKVVIDFSVMIVFMKRISALSIALKMHFLHSLSVCEIE